MLQPKKLKFRKQFRGKMRGFAIKGSNLEFGEFGLKSLGRGWITDRQLEAARKAASHFTKRQGKIWIRVFPDKPITKKAAGSRMGGGKGDPEGFVCVVIPGKIIFELSGISSISAHKALNLAAQKLPLKTKIITKNLL
jgi:large subunit ribosomal protein L16